MPSPPSPCPLDSFAAARDFDPAGPARVCQDCGDGADVGDYRAGAATVRVCWECKSIRELLGGALLTPVCQTR